MSEAERLLDLQHSDAVYNVRAGAGFNGQRLRKAIVGDLFERCGFTLAVETGAHCGDTAGYLATEYGVTVHSCEITPRYFHVASHLLRDVEGVQIHNLDSRELLRKLSTAHQGQPTFLYLDAHWYEDLPLAEELEIVARNWENWVAVVDDFEVPDDDGYGFDDYGPGKRLNLEYLAPVLRRHRLSAFAPAEPSTKETGARRGCLVTCASRMAPTVAASPLLRAVPVPES
jgi:hypothetical protein